MLSSKYLAVGVLLHPQRNPISQMLPLFFINLLATFLPIGESVQINTASAISPAAARILSFTPATPFFPWEPINSHAPNSIARDFSLSLSITIILLIPSVFNAATVRRPSIPHPSTTAVLSASSLHILDMRSTSV